MTYLSVKEAAKLAGKNERTIRRWILAGKVNYTEIKGKYHVRKDSLEEIKNISQNRRISENKDKKSEKNNEIPDAVSEKTGHNMIKRMSKKIINIEPIFVKDEKYSDIIQEKDIFTTNKLVEGMEYQITDKKKFVSANSQNSMSVKNIGEIDLNTDNLDSDAVEMSIFSKDKMSDSRKSFINNNNDHGHIGNMSGFSTTLSTNSDNDVDKMFDIDGISLNHINDNFSDTKNGHTNGIVEMSAYAVRLLEEKERVTKKIEEQNDYLKKQINVLNEDIISIRKTIDNSLNNNRMYAQNVKDNADNWRSIALDYITAEKTKKNEIKSIIDSEKANVAQPRNILNANTNLFWLGLILVIAGNIALTIAMSLIINLNK